MRNKEYLKILVVILSVGFSAYILNSIYNKYSNQYVEGFNEGEDNDKEKKQAKKKSELPSDSPDLNESYADYQEDNNNNEQFDTNTVDDSQYNDMRSSSCFPQAQLSPNELLPLNDPASAWASVNPQSTFGGKNFLQAGWVAGISSVGSTLRNANRQLRSEPPNPQVRVSPWMQTTVEPDITRKPFEIGGCA